MSVFDLILLIILFGYVLFGLWFGLIQTFGSLVGVFVGTFFAGIFYEPIGAWLTGIFGHPNLMRVLAFLFIFILINRLIGFGFHILDKIFKFVNILPFIKTASRMLGAVIGFFEGILVIGLALFVLSRFPLADWFTNALQNSALTHWFIKTSVVLQFVLPELLKSLESFI